MPQIQINGELREVSQEEYDALNQNSPPATPVEGSYEQYAAAQAKAQAVEKLADADGAVVGDTNVSPEYKQDLASIRTSADAAAGTNKDAYAERYAQEQQDLYINAPTSRAALESELSAPPPITSPGTVAVQKEYQQGTDGQVIGTLNTTNNVPDSTSGSIVGSPVRGLTAGGITSSAAPAPTYPTEDPQIPPPSTEGVGAFTPPPAPDAAFAQAQVAKEERWQQAAATNPEGIQDNGSVKTQLPDGTVETINRDGSYSVSGADGTFRFNADGQVDSYTSPTVNGLSVTTTTDGVKYTNYTNGPLTTSTIEKDGELISSDITYNTGDTTLRATQVGDGEIVKTQSTVVDGDKVQGYTIEQTVQVGEGEIVTQTIQTETAEARTAAYEQAAAENVKLREDLIAAKEQQQAGIPLSDTQIAALEEQAQTSAEADAALAQAEQAVAEQDPTVVAAGEDPQVIEPVTEDPVPSLATTEVAPTTVDPVNDPQAAEPAGDFVPVADVDVAPAEVTKDDPQAIEPAQDNVAAADVDVAPAEVTEDPVVQGLEAAQTEEATVPAADVDFAAAAVDPAEDPAVPQPVDDLPEAFVYTEAGVPTDDPIVLAQANTTATDVVLVDLVAEPPLVDQEIDLEAPQPAAPISQGGFYGEPTPVGGNYTSVYDPETGNYSVVDIDTGETVETGLSQQQATIAAQDLSLGDPQFPNETEDLAAAAASDIVREPTDVDVAEAAFTEQGDGFFVLNEEAAPQPDEFGFVETEGGLFVQQDEIEAQIDQEQFEDALGAEDLSASDIVTEPEDISLDQQYQDEPPDTLLDLNTGERVTAGEAQSEAARIEAQRQNLRNQQSIREQRGNNVDSADWRVRLRLAPGARYLYQDTEYGPGILDPLSVSDGVIFPYTPTVQTVYKADYTPYNLTHSNYRGFFYQSSYVEDINITGTFTAQDSVEAAYLLAVIHFFRSATKMFYGQDPNRGAPPPLVYLSAFGAYQYVDAPCVISQFNYNLPADVDYIRARSPNQDGTSLLKRRERQNLPTNAFTAALQRLKNARPGGLPPGGEVKKPAPPTLGLQSPTYVPTKMEITIVLHPMQSRRQVSQQFSVQEYAPGRLTPKGFW